MKKLTFLSAALAIASTASFAQESLNSTSSLLSNDTTHFKYATEDHSGLDASGLGIDWGFDTSSIADNSFVRIGYQYSESTFITKVEAELAVGYTHTLTSVSAVDFTLGSRFTKVSTPWGKGDTDGFSFGGTYKHVFNENILLTGTAEYYEGDFSPIVGAEISLFEDISIGGKMNLGSDDETLTLFIRTLI